MKIKAAFIGYGRTADLHHAPAIASLPEYEVHGVYTMRPESSGRAAARFGCKVYASYREALADSETDLAIIITTNDLHASMAADFLLAGKNVLVTKPWAMDSAQAEELISAARKSGKQLLPWLPCRWSDDLKRLKELVASGAVGKVFAVRRGFYSFGKRSDWQTLRKFGGGYLLNWGPHLADQPIQLIGEPVTRVYGEMKQVINPGDAEDVFLAIMTTSGGVTLTAEYNVAAEGLPSWVVQGDRGTIYVWKDRFEIHAVSWPEPQDSSAYRSQYQVEKSVELFPEDISLYGSEKEIYRHIARALSGAEPYAVTLESAAALTRVLDAIRASALTGETVRLEGNTEI